MLELNIGYSYSSNVSLSYWTHGQLQQLRPWWRTMWQTSYCQQICQIGTTNSNRTVVLSKLVKYYWFKNTILILKLKWDYLKHKPFWALKQLVMLLSSLLQSSNKQEIYLFIYLTFYFSFFLGTYSSVLVLPFNSISCSGWSRSGSSRYSRGLSGPHLSLSRLCLS